MSNSVDYPGIQLFLNRLNRLIKSISVILFVALFIVIVIFMFLLPSNPPLSSNYSGLISAWIQLLMLGIFALSVISLLTGIITYLVFKFKNRKGLIMEYSIKLIQKGVILLVLLFIIYNIIQFILHRTHFFY
jgi:hypothetical protein